MVVFSHSCITCKSGKFYRQREAKKPHTQYTFVTWGLSVKTGKFTCIYAASLSRRKHCTACNKARKLKVTPPAGRSLTYLQLQVLLAPIAGVLVANRMYFCLRLQVVLPAILVFLPAIACIFV